MAQPADTVKAAAAKAVTAGISRVVTALVDPAAAAKSAAGTLRELPTAAARLPMRAVVGGLVLLEKVRSRGTDDQPEVSSADERSGADGAYVEAQQETDLLASAGEGPLAAEVDAVLDAAGEDSIGGTAAAATGATSTPGSALPSGSEVSAAATDIAAAPTAGASGATSVGEASVTPIHAGRDGHREIDLPPAQEAAVAAAEPGAGLSSSELPLQGYDGMSLAQIRGRLSKLDVVSLAQLRDYERAHADRAGVVTMLENRLAKMAAQGEVPGAQVDPLPAPPSSSPGADGSGPVSPATDRGDAAVEVGGAAGRDPRS